MMNYENQTFPKDKYITGATLYQYLHISKRKMKYLLENGLIPYIDTGKKTHRYIVKKSDAKEFRKRLLKDESLIASMKGQFSSERTTPTGLLAIMVTPELSKEFKEFLKSKWADEPDAIGAKRAATLCGIQSQRIYTLCSKKKIFSVKIRERVYCSKDSVIDFYGSIEKMSKPNVTKAYSELLKEFYNIE